MLIDTLENKYAGQTELAAEIAAATENVQDAQTWETLGLALAKVGAYQDAIAAYAFGIGIDPFKGILYRHRGHRYISVLRFAEAAADLTLASRLIPENWDVWYHLGLAQFLLGDYAAAKQSYLRCYELNYDDESLVAISNWLWITLKRLGEDQEAQAVLDRVGDNLTIIENIGYYDLLMIYKKKLAADEVFKTLEETPQDSLNLVTKGFGLSNYYLFAADEAKRLSVLQFIHQIEDKKWTYAFGYIAATVDLEQMTS